VSPRPHKLPSQDRTYGGQSDCRSRPCRSVLLALLHLSNRVRVICEGEPWPHCAMRAGSNEQPESALHYAVSPFRDRDAGVVPGTGVGFSLGAAREARLGWRCSDAKQRDPVHAAIAVSADISRLRERRSIVELDRFPASDLSNEGLPLEPFTVHDLHRTGSTLLNELGLIATGSRNPRPTKKGTPRAVSITRPSISSSAAICFRSGRISSMPGLKAESARRRSIRLRCTDPSGAYDQSPCRSERERPGEIIMFEGA
jgi:hypothetical protein